MRTLCFMLAFACVLLGPTITGNADTRLPGIGTFEYGRTQIAISAHDAMIVAAR
jgi:hypothetical protein